MNNFDTTDIEDTFKGIVKGGGVTAHVYCNRPKSKEQHDDFAVVSMSLGTEDRRTFGECNVSITLFARDVAGEKNGKKLKLMYTRVLAAMPAATGRYIIDPNPLLLPDAPDDFGFHTRTIDYKVTIKIQ